MSRRPLVAAVCALAVGAAVLTGQVPARAASSVTVNGSTTYQTITGFGVSEAFGQANAIRYLDATTQKQALDMLFNTSTGAGFTIVRNLIPSDASHTMEPNAPSSPSATPTYVWDGSNDATDWGQLWLAKRAKTYGVTTFYNDAWSAPGFMKTNGNEANGGYLCGSPGESCSSGDWRQAYANYLVQHAKNWASVGITPSYLGFANEPSFTTGYSSMLVNSSQAADFVKVLGPTLKNSGLSTKITCCDTLGWNLLPGYTSAIGADSTANSYLGLYTSHGYSNAPTSTISTGGKPVWESEWSTQNSWDTAWDDGTADSGFAWASNIYTGLTAANLNAFLYWWGISNSQGGGTLVGLSGTALTAAKRYWSFVNYSRYIRPNATRIAATTGDSNLKVTAVKNTDGSVVLVVLNASSSATSTSFSLANTGITAGTVHPYLTNAGNNAAAQSTVSLFNGAFSASVPARSLVTYRITA